MFSNHYLLTLSRPRGVERVRGSIPTNYTITDDDIKGVLPTGKTIASEIEAGRLFMIDNSIMEGIPCGQHPIVKVCNKLVSKDELIYLDAKLYLLSAPTTTLQ